MKRIVLLLGFGIVCIGAVSFAAPRFVAARQTADRNAAYAQMMTKNGPLVLDGATQAVLAHADRVETFRLVNPNADSDETAMPIGSSPQSRAIGPFPRSVERHRSGEEEPLAGQAKQRETRAPGRSERHEFSASVHARPIDRAGFVHTNTRRRQRRSDGSYRRDR